jgi:hypothetical protein
MHRMDAVHFVEKLCRVTFRGYMKFLQNAVEQKFG